MPDTIQISAAAKKVLGRLHASYDDHIHLSDFIRLRWTKKVHIVEYKNRARRNVRAIEELIRHNLCAFRIDEGWDDDADIPHHDLVVTFTDSGFEYAQRSDAYWCSEYAKCSDARPANSCPSERVPDPEHVTPCAKMIISDIASSRWRNASLFDLTCYSQAHASDDEAVESAREFARAVEDLIKLGLGTLWVVDLWDHEAMTVTSLPVIYLTCSGREYAKTLV